MDLRTIVVVWMDDREETYDGVQTSVRDEVLHIFRYHPKTLKMTREWHLPISNIRYWYPDGQDGT